MKKGIGASRNDLRASTYQLQLARMAGCKTDFLSTLHVYAKKNLDYYFLVTQEQTLCTRGNAALLELSPVYG